MIPHKFGLLDQDILSFSLTDFCGQVSEHLPAIQGFNASVHLDSASKNRVCALRSIPIHLENEVHKELKCLESLGIIMPCSYDSIQNASPWFGLRKRMAICGSVLITKCISNLD